MMMPCSMNIRIRNNIISFFLILLVLILQQEQVFTSSSSSSLLLLSTSRKTKISSSGAASSLSIESKILRKFKDSLKPSSLSILSGWNSSNKNPPCTADKSNWVGVLCDNGSVWGLKLENMGLRGDVDVDSLSELKSLRTISLMYNNFSTSLPNISKLSSLKTIYLSFNQFSGEIPSDAFEGMGSLKKVHLAHNKFSGPIPSSLTTLPKLMELMLDYNLFEGQLPSFPQERLVNVNFSSNRLTGRIPTTLSHLNASSFSNNENLCGEPLLKQCSVLPRVSIAAIVLILVAIFIAICAIIAVIIILSRRRKTIPDQEEQHITPITTTATTELMSPKNKNTSATSPPSPLSPTAPHHLDVMERGSMMPAAAKTIPKKSTSPPQDHQLANIKLTFLGDDIEKFDMNDLLKASAEILGSGSFGSSYKVSLTDGQTMVVKRYRQMNTVSRQEFQEHMRRLGGLKHPNLLPISAFYFKKDEKLFISRYIDNVSLAAHLHGSKSRGKTSLDWPTRLKIVKGVSKGVLYLYNSLPSLIAPHGHLKSSNVLLTHSCEEEPLLTDYGLIPVVNLEHAQDQMVAYKSPEFRLTGRITKKTDVWSLGILILEVLTGKFPSSFLQQGNNDSNRGGGGGGGRYETDLSTWVLSVIKDDQWTAMDVFDPEMMMLMKERSSSSSSPVKIKNSEAQMVKLLMIALRCCEVEINKRLDIREAVEMIQEIKETDKNNSCSNYSVGGGDDELFYSSHTSDGDIQYFSKEDLQTLK